MKKLLAMVALFVGFVILLLAPLPSATQKAGAAEPTTITANSQPAIVATMVTNSPSPPSIVSAAWAASINAASVTQLVGFSVNCGTGPPGGALGGCNQQNSPPAVHLNPGLPAMSPSSASMTTGDGLDFTTITAAVRPVAGCYSFNSHRSWDAFLPSAPSSMVGTIAHLASSALGTIAGSIAMLHHELASANASGTNATLPVAPYAMAITVPIGFPIDNLMLFGLAIVVVLLTARMVQPRLPTTCGRRLWLILGRTFLNKLVAWCASRGPTFSAKKFRRRIGRVALNQMTLLVTSGLVRHAAHTTTRSTGNLLAYSRRKQQRLTGRVAANPTDGLAIFLLRSPVRPRWAET